MERTFLQALNMWHVTGLWFGDVKSGNIVVESLPYGGVRVYLIDLESYIVSSDSGVATLPSGHKVRVTVAALVNHAACCDVRPLL